MGKLLALMIALVSALWLAAAADATPSASLHVTPTSVAAGDAVQVSGTCEPTTTGFAISQALLHDATHDFAGVGAASFTTDTAGSFAVTAQVPASITPGSYAVTGRCGGGNLGISATLTVTAAAAGPPTAVPAGTGGQAAATTASTVHRQELLAAIGGILLAVGGLGITRLRRTPH
jgi:hypothetical protein